MPKKNEVTETAAGAVVQEAVTAEAMGHETTVAEVQDPDTMGFNGKEGI